MDESNEKKTTKKKPGSFMKELLSGVLVSDKIVLKNFWYFILLTILGAIYIGNRFQVEKLTRETSRLSREVRDLRAEELSTSATLISVSRQSEVYKMVHDNGLGLEELKTPPYKLIVDKK